MRRALGAILALVVVSGCATRVGPSPSATPPISTTASPSASDEPTTAPATPSPTPAVAVDPGRPYDAAAILAAMGASRRPEGVPDQLETDAIAAAVADRIWTFDGEPWTSMSIGGSCGPSSCTLEVGGAPADAVGEDLYVMQVTPSTGSVEPVEATLQGLRQDVVDRLDALARAASDGDALEYLVLASAGWQAPPHATEFVLSYRSGGEEGAPAVDLIIDVASGSITQR